MSPIAIEDTETPSAADAAPSLSLAEAVASASLWFAGPCQAYHDGDKLEYGAQGQVKGAAPPDDNGDECVAMLFSFNKEPISCRLTNVRG